jgi:hypothetical protein
LFQLRSKSGNWSNYLSNSGLGVCPGDGAMQK